MRKVAAELRDHYWFDVTLLTDATRAELLGALSKLQQLGPSDNLLIYCTGQGGYNEQAEQGHWLTVDAAAGNYTNGLSNAELTTILKGLTVRQVQAITDCSYGGVLARAICIGLGQADLRSPVAKGGALGDGRVRSLERSAVITVTVTARTPSRSWY